ncbi:hypothetical protein CPC08DRAFT_474278 [Agrocybe pediades]|nr:hypothetical protein CPC08DRAFT_474278 [Agrocybe pediades]
MLLSYTSTSVHSMPCSFDVRCACGSTTFHALLQNPLLGLVEGRDLCGGTSSMYAVCNGWRKFELCLQIDIIKHQSNSQPKTGRGT